MSRRTNQPKPNGHAGPNGRINASGDRKAVNGRGTASTGWDGVPAPACSPGRAYAGRDLDRAASVDASGTPVANTASCATAVGTDREACAEVAPFPPNGATYSASQETSPLPKKRKGEEEVPPGEVPLPDDPAEFVEEVHRKIDLTEVWHGLLQSKDEKIKQRAAEKLTEMRYKGASSLADEPSQVVIDIDSAVARRTAEGAKK